MESPSNGKGVQKICIFSWNFYIKIKEKISLWPDGNQGVSKERQLRVTVFHWSSTMQFTVLSLSALPHNMLRVFTMCSLCAQCAATSQRTLRGLHASSLDLSLCLYWDMWVAWAWQQSSSGAAGDPTTLPRQPHFVSTACLSERRTTTVLCITKNVEWHSLDPTITDEDATALLHHCRRLY